jgi:hypothetical protein
MTGALLGFSIYNTFFFKTNSETLFITILFISIFLFTYLAYKEREEIIIYGTSFIGSYALVRGISLLAGNYPSEAETWFLLKHNMTSEYDFKFYVYLILMLIIFMYSSRY